MIDVKWREGFEVQNYECDYITGEEFYRFLRVRRLGNNSTGWWHLQLSQIEFFGLLEQQ